MPDTGSAPTVALPIFSQETVAQEQLACTPHPCSLPSSNRPPSEELTPCLMTQFPPCGICLCSCKYARSLGVGGIGTRCSCCPPVCGDRGSPSCSLTVVLDTYYICNLICPALPGSQQYHANHQSDKASERPWFPFKAITIHPGAQGATHASVHRRGLTSMFKCFLLSLSGPSRFAAFSPSSALKNWPSWPSDFSGGSTTEGTRGGEARACPGG